MAHFFGCYATQRAIVYILYNAPSETARLYRDSIAYCTCISGKLDCDLYLMKYKLKILKYFVTTFTTCTCIQELLESIEIGR